MLGVAFGIQALTNTVFQLPFGHLADHYDRTLALALSSFLGAVGVIVVAIAPSLRWLVVGQAIIGVGVAGHHPAHYPLLTDATPEGFRGRAFSVYNFGGTIGFADSPAVITAIIAVPGLTWRHAIGLFGVVGLAYAAVITALFARRVSGEVTGPNVDRTASAVERVRGELKSLLSDPGILALAALALVASTANWGLTSYAVVFLTDAYGVPLDRANLALTDLFLSGAVGVLAGGSLTDRFAPAPVLLGSFVGLTVLVGAIATGLVPVLVAVGLFLLVGGIRNLEGPARESLTEQLAGEGTIGKSFAVITIGIMAGSAIAPPVFGYLIEWFDVQIAFIAVAVVAALATVLTAAIVFRLQETPGPTPVPGE